MPLLDAWYDRLDADRVEASKREGGAPLPSMHSDRYYPVPEPTIRTAANR